ncbi:hypothetical protein ACOMHN_031974 [Nucella lapillus]
MEVTLQTQQDACLSRLRSAVGNERAGQRSAVGNERAGQRSAVGNERAGQRSAVGNERAGQRSAVGNERAGQRSAVGNERAGQRSAVGNERAGQRYAVGNERAGQRSAVGNERAGQRSAVGNKRAGQRSAVGNERAGQGSAAGNERAGQRSAVGNERAGQRSAVGNERAGQRSAVGNERAGGGLGRLRPPADRPSAYRCGVFGVADAGVSGRDRGVVSPHPGSTPGRGGNSPRDRLLSPRHTGGVSWTGQDRQDLQVQDLASDDLDRQSTHSQLESESVYLPIRGGQTPPSPLAPCSLPQRLQSRLPVTSQPPVTAPQCSLTRSPATASSASSPRTIGVSSRLQTSPQTSPESRQAWKEGREVRTHNREIGRGRLRANFTAVSVPRLSDAGPQTRTPRPDRPPTAASQDYDMSLDTSSHTSPPLPTPSPTPTTTTTTTTSTSTTVPAAQVSLIHRVVDSKRSARLQQQQNMRHTPPPHSSSSSSTAPPPSTTSHIPTLGQQQQQKQQQQQQQQQQGTKGSRGRVKGLDSNRQAELSKLLKCQQNAERLNQHRDRPGPGPALHLSTDSGFQSRPASDAVLTDYGQEGQRAATVLQAAWRGHWARESSLEVVSVRKEIRARRAEDHIVLLRADLDRHKKLYNEEKRLRTLQMEAIRCLYQEVQQLKSQVQGQGSSVPGSRPGTADSLMTTGSGGSLGQSGASTGSNLGDLQRTAELERTCQSLQNQVWDLQQTLQSMTSHVFRQDSMDLPSLPSTADADQLTTVQVLECQEGQVPASHSEPQSAARYWSSIPHSLSPYPSEEEDVYFRQVPRHGAPTPPRSLTLRHQTEQALQLHWLPPPVGADHTAHAQSVVTGYRVYVNDQPRGSVGHQRTVALVCGLCPSKTYKFYVRAMSSVGESYDSDIVMGCLTHGGDPHLHQQQQQQQQQRQRLSDSSDSDVLPDSDKDRDSSDVIDKRRPRKREGRKTRKARSPRSEKKSVSRITGEEREGGGGGAREGGAPSRQHQQEGESSVQGILTTAKIHTHRRTSSREQSELSSLQSDSAPSTPSRAGEETHRPASRTTPPSARSTPPPVRSTPTPTKELVAQPDVVRQRRAGSPARDLSFKSPSPSPLERRGGGRGSPGSQDGEQRLVASPHAMEDAPETPLVLSETFDVDRAKSFLRNLTTPPPRAPLEGPGSAEGAGSFVKGHQRKHSKDLNQESGGGGGGVSSHRDRSSPDRASSLPESHSGEQEGEKVKTHRRTRSRELNPPTPLEEGGREERERCSTPVLDGRKRGSSRPSSPMIFDGPSLDQDSPLADLSRRKTMAENLVQRLRKSPSPGSTSGGRDGEEGEKVSPQYGNRSRKQSPGSDSLPEEDPSLPRHRTHSVGSEGDLVCAGGRLYSTSVLSKLDLLESRLTERKRLRKRSSEDEAPQRVAGRTRHVSESDNDMSSDPGSHLPPRAPVASDSSSGSHSDDSKARHHRHHRRSPSDQRPLTGSGYSSDQVAGRATHSPIIMEGGGKKGGSSVRRNASFHALLPSRPHDSQPSPAPEVRIGGPEVGDSDFIDDFIDDFIGHGVWRRGRGDTQGGGGQSTGAGTETLAHVRYLCACTHCQESQGNPRSSIRSRSPSPGPNRQPILSGAQLKRHTSDPAKPSPS